MLSTAAPFSNLLKSVNLNFESSRNFFFDNITWKSVRYTSLGFLRVSVTVIVLYFFLDIQEGPGKRVSTKELRTVSHRVQTSSFHILSTCGENFLRNSCCLRFSLDYVDINSPRRVSVAKLSCWPWEIKGLSHTIHQFRNVESVLSDFLFRWFRTYTNAEWKLYEKSSLFIYPPWVPICCYGWERYSKVGSLLSREYKSNDSLLSTILDASGDTHMLS